MCITDGTTTETELSKLKEEVAKHDKDLSNQLTEIMTLQRKVNTLTALMESFFAYTSSTQRFSEEQENAFKKIPGLLKEL